MNQVRPCLECWNREGEWAMAKFHSHQDFDFSFLGVIMIYLHTHPITITIFHIPNAP